MCIFSQPVRQVGETRIFAREQAGQQLLAYQMRLWAAVDLAMVLPLPVVQPATETDVRFISLEMYPRLFSDLNALFPEPVSAAFGAAPVPAQRPATLVVHEVGAFEASFVPAMADFARLDPRFRIDASVWRSLPEYGDWGFAVFKLRAAPHASRVHPMALSFPTRLGERLYFPTRHVHDRKVHQKARYDHQLYCQMRGPEGDKQPQSGLGHWWPSAAPARSTVAVNRTGGLVDGDSGCFRFTICGKMENRDFYAYG